METILIPREALNLLTSALAERPFKDVAPVFEKVQQLITDMENQQREKDKAGPQ